MASSADNDLGTRVDTGAAGTTSATHGALVNLMASSAAALCSRLCTHPLDTLKTRVQVSNTPLPLLPTFLGLVRNGGLYRGLPVALTLSAPGLSVYLAAYDLSKDAISRHFPVMRSDSVINHMASAVVAEVLSGLFWTPMEVLKQKQQVENIPSSAPRCSTNVASKHRLSMVAPKTWLSSFSTVSAYRATAAERTPTTAMELARRIYRQEGLLGFYRGYFITLGVFVPYSMVYFATYEQLKESAWRQRILPTTTGTNTRQEGALPFLTIVACAAVAAGFAGGISNIVDVVKTRWQISVLATTEENSSTRNIVRHMLRQGGLGSFTQGMGARVLWMIPSVTISMSIFEWLKANGIA
ncbi:hypothetical protein BGZ98_006688 [Dissophora globulifera]|nr:hypothetical protein BGZ98_006688 [Dissophora globulifera]